MSTDKAEWELAKIVQERASMHFIQMSEEANAAVRCVLN